MNLLKSLGKQQKIGVLIILILIISSLLCWNRYENYLERERYTQSYEKLYEENQLLKDEIDNLKEQNQSLERVLELKTKLE